MKKSIGIALVLGAGMVSTNASAAKLVAGEHARANMTYTTIDQVESSRTSEYSGVGSIFISTRSTATTGFGGICTASLIGSGSVLTAAHCLETDANDPITNIRLFLPSLGDRSGAREVFTVSEFAIHPDYAETGLVGGNDIAGLKITGDTSAYDKYELYLGNPLQQFTAVGTGTIGGPAGTGIGIAGQDYRKREGNNVYELFGDQLFSDVGSGVVLYDFDDGTAEHDVFGRNLGLNGLGVENEAAASPGDSGGPSFINGQIAAVTSFGITGGIFQGYCGDDSTDPFNRAGLTTRTALNQCTNSSVGEIGGNTLVSANIDFVQGFLDGTVETMAPVPEPSTWLMMLAGFAFVGGSMRRRPKTVKPVMA
ncbi:MAG: trypsin-like serine protease [Pontixanthobacter sp.]